MTFFLIDSEDQMSKQTSNQGLKKKLKQLQAQNQKLKNENKFLQSGLNSFDDIMLITDRQGKIIGFNSVATILKPANEKTLEEYSIQELFDSLDRDFDLKFDDLLKITRHNTIKQKENDFIITTRDKNKYQLVQSNVIDENIKKNNPAFIFIFKKIDGHTDIEQALRESQRQIETLISNLPGIAYRCRNIHNWRMEYISQGCLELTGYEPSDIVKNKKISYEEIIHPDDRAMVWEEVQAAVQNKRHFNFEYRIVTRSNEVKWVWERGICLNCKDGKTEVLEGFISDITERKHAQEKLRASEAKYHNLIDRSNDAIYLLYNNKFEVINKKFEEIFGITQKETTADDFNFMELVAPKSRPLVRERIQKFRNGEDTRSRYEFTALDTDGKEIEVEVSVSYIPYKDSYAAQGVLRDITHRKKLQERLQQTQKLESIGTLAGGIAHDFNNILTVIIGLTQLVLDQTDKSDFRYNHLKNINESGERAARLTRQLLLFSRKQDMNFQPLDLNRTIINISSMLKRLIGENINLNHNFDKNLELINADENQIEQVITNLVINSRDSMPDGGNITISTKNHIIDKQQAESMPDIQPGKYVQFSVEDEGCGIKDKIKEKIFDPFFTTKGRAKGSGMGLAVVHGIIKKHKGSINIYSEPEKGTNFKVYLPVAQSKSSLDTDQDGQDIENYQGMEQGILIAEDEDQVLKYLEKMLTNYNYNVYKASSGEKALEIYRNNRDQIQLLLSDVIMGKMDGIQLAEQLQKITPDLKVILSSGYSDNRIDRSNIMAKGFKFIQKPYNIEDLLQKVYQILQ